MIINNEHGVYIDWDKCTECLECINYCRSGALTEKDGELQVDKSVCHLDEGCLGVCSEKAITVVLTNGYEVNR